MPPKRPLPSHTYVQGRMCGWAMAVSWPIAHYFVLHSLGEWAAISVGLLLANERPFLETCRPFVVVFHTAQLSSPWMRQTSSVDLSPQQETVQEAAAVHCGHSEELPGVLLAQEVPAAAAGGAYLPAARPRPARPPPLQPAPGGEEEQGGGGGEEAQRGAEGDGEVRCRYL